MIGRLHFKIIGAGPSGLYLAYLLKRSNPACIVRVVEQNPPDATYGFGVVLSGRALSFLREGDRAAIERLASKMETWGEQHIVHRGELVRIDGSGYSAIERLLMLQELQRLCQKEGVDIAFNQRFEAIGDRRDCDVLVAADGANSVVRDCFPQAFDTRIIDLQNYFAWYGVETPYPAHTLTFVKYKGGAYCAHHYRYTPTKSTFVAETDDQTWLGSGMSTMSDDERKAHMKGVFAASLGGKPLISNRSLWRRWRLVKNGRWHHENIVLIGDAQRTAHPSIGSGTRLAMEDAIALWRAFEEKGPDIGGAFRLYEASRRPIRDKLNLAGERSIAWYEQMAEKMDLSPYEFAYDYMLRTGVMTPERLGKESPAFMEAYRERSRHPIKEA